MRNPISALLSLLLCSPALAAGPAADLLSSLAPAGAPAARVPLAPEPQDAAADALRAEALLDPAAFIDGHTPEEVALAFGLRPDRYLVTDKKRIENALVKLTVNLSTQRLKMESGGETLFFRISSGLPPKHATPGSGKCYAPDFMEKMHYSSLYNSAPMPHSIFFNGNIALHGTQAEHLLGRPASHGCVRLSRAASEMVFNEVKSKGSKNAIVCVTGVTPQ